MGLDYYIKPFQISNILHIKRCYIQPIWHVHNETMKITLTGKLFVEINYHQNLATYWDQIVNMNGVHSVMRVLSLYYKTHLIHCLNCVAYTHICTGLNRIMYRTVSWSTLWLSVCLTWFRTYINVRYVLAPFVISVAGRLCS